MGEGKHTVPCERHGRFARGGLASPLDLLCAHPGAAQDDPRLQGTRRSPASQGRWKQEAPPPTPSKEDHSPPISSGQLDPHRGSGNRPALFLAPLWAPEPCPNF